MNYITATVGIVRFFITRGFWLSVPCVFILSLSSCRQGEVLPANSEPDISYADPVIFAVERVELVREYTPPARYPNVEHLFPIPPYEAIADWSNRSLRAAGKEGVLVVEITDASVTETPLEKTEGIAGWFSIEPSERYDARLEVKMKLYVSGGALADAEISAVATATRSIREDATLESREALFNGITAELVKLIDRQLRRQVRRYFSRYVITSG